MGEQTVYEKKKSTVRFLLYLIHRHRSRRFLFVRDCSVFLGLLFISLGFVLLSLFAAHKTGHFSLSANRLLYLTALSAIVLISAKKK